MWRLLGPKRLRRVRLKAHWRGFVVALALCAIAGMVLLYLAPGLSGLYLFGVYAIPTNSILPLPHEPGLLYFARFYDPLWIAIAGTLGTGVAAFADYEVVGLAMRHPKIKGARETRVYKWALRWLMRFPFFTVWLFSFTPLPIYVVRVLAPASGYPFWRYLCALMLGRLPRFYAVAWLGHTFPLPGWFLLLLFVALIGSFFIASKQTGIADEGEEGGEPIVIPDLTDPEHPHFGSSGSSASRE